MKIVLDKYDSKANEYIAHEVGKTALFIVDPFVGCAIDPDELEDDGECLEGSTWEVLSYVVHRVDVILPREGSMVRLDPKHERTDTGETTTPEETRQIMERAK